MLIIVYKNEKSIHGYINTKDIKRFFIENSDEKRLYDLKAETYTKELYDVCWYITIEEYDYIMCKISKAIQENESIIKPFDFQCTFEKFSFYNYCIRQIDKINKESQDNLFKVLEEVPEYAEIDNLSFFVIINNLSDENSKNIFNKLRMDYEKEIALSDGCLARCLRIS